MTAVLAALPPALTLPFAGAFGAVIGSFLNVVVWRVPRGESLVAPGSTCPKCGAEIAWYDNIPLVSWLVLRAKCRRCGDPISARYPLVEAGGALAFLAVALGAIWGWYPLALAPALAYLAAISIALALIDLDHHILPNAIVYPSYVVLGVLLVLASALTGDWWALARAAAGGAILFGAYLAMALVYPAGMGLGDVKLAGLLGLVLGWLGWMPLAVGGFAAFLIGGVIAVVLLAAKRATRKSGIPFGPSMLAGAWVGIFAGNILGQAYLNLVGLS